MSQYTALRDNLKSCVSIMVMLPRSEDHSGTYSWQFETLAN